MKTPKNKKSENEGRPSGRDDEVMTVGKFQYYFESIKDLIVSSTKSVETSLRKEIQKVQNGLELTQHAVMEHSKQIIALQKDVKVIKDDVSVLKTDVSLLKTDVADIKVELKETKDTLHNEMKEMEERLSNKIDQNSAVQKDHEVRITTLETVV